MRLLQQDLKHRSQSDVESKSNLSPPHSQSRPSSEMSLFATSRNPSGIQPLNWLPLRNRCTRFSRLPSSLGISPVN